MIVVNGAVKTTPETIAALQGAISTMETASRAEPGCIDYTFSVELNDSSVIRITEKWQTLDDLKAHFATPHMAEFQRVMEGWDSNQPGAGTRQMIKDEFVSLYTEY